jgi:hypothetical protein
MLSWSKHSSLFLFSFATGLFFSQEKRRRRKYSAPFFMCLLSYELLYTAVTKIGGYSRGNENTITLLSMLVNAVRTFIHLGFHYFRKVSSLKMP